MAFIDAHCRAIASKAAGGKLSEEDILAAFAEIDRRKATLQAAGAATGKAEKIRQWAVDEGERTKIAAAMQRRHAALNIIVRQRVDAAVKGMVAGGLKPHQALRAVLEGINSPAPGSRNSAAAAVQGYEAHYIGGMWADLQRDRPHLRNMMHDPKFDADTLVEMWELRKDGNPGSTGNADAQYVAKLFADYAELSRTELNRLGASIGKLDGWAGAQTHDDVKMIQAGKDAWIGRIMPLLDHERTFWPGVSSTEVIDVLGDIYDTIITGIPAAPTAARKGERVNPANLAKSLGKSRVLHFKDASAALTYRDQFGYGNTVAGMFSHLRNAARVAGLMETLGPNPELMFRAIAAKMQDDLKRSSLPDVDKQKLIQKLNTEGGALRHAIDVATGLTSRPVNVNTAKIGSDIRMGQNMAKLGAALPSSFTDPVTAAAAAQFRGSGFFKSFMAQMGGVLRGRPKEEQAQISYLIGEGFDGMVGHIVNNFAAQDGPAGVMGKLQEQFFRWNGLTWWTDVQRSVAARTISAELGMHAGTAFAELPPRFRNVLTQAGFTPTEWDALGKVALRLDNGRPYMTPDRVRELSDADIAPLVADRLAAARKVSGVDEVQSAQLKQIREARYLELARGILDDGRRRLQIKMLSYVADQTSYAVIEPSARTRRYTTLGTQPGTMGGEVLRFIMQFKSFPLAFTERVVGRALFGQRAGAGLAEKGAHIGSLLAGLTVAGYAAMVAKDTLKGYWPPRNPADPRTIIAAMQQGGAWGIYGDYLFSQTNRFGGGLLETAAGPTAGTLGDLWTIWNQARDAGVDAASGEDGKFPLAKTFSTLWSNTPFMNLHLVKPAIDFLIVNSIREALSPGYLKGQRRQRAKDYGQTYMPQEAGLPPALDPLNITQSF